MIEATVALEVRAMREVAVARGGSSEGGIVTLFRGGGESAGSSEAVVWERGEGSSEGGDSFPDPSLA